MKILFLVPPQVHLLDITGPAHIFYEAKVFHPELELCFFSIDPSVEVESSAGLFFSRLTPFESYSLGKGDYIFIPGIEYSVLSDPAFLQASQGFFEWLRVQQAAGATICSVCTGAFLVAEAGLLNQRNCTTHWAYFSRFAAKFPEAELKRNRLFVEDRGIFTSAGVSSGIDLSLFILERLYGQRLAYEIAKITVVYTRRGSDDPQLSVFLRHGNHLEDRVHAAQQYIFEHLGEKLPTATIADQVNMSPRNLTRLFKKATGLTIGEYLNKVRAEKASHLLREGHKLEYVASQCGFEGVSQLRKLLKAAHEMDGELISILVLSE
ncbi:GlxA family transcriptional regulator [Rufibacter glacialis]|uniref:GlxA family transcriptional regulator n=1 Tax=Rufibacter glacialis TaxID=1259555 RepID=A0A5M8QBI7_9BACT|nr:helix-turn-helix domain-containing protein [Rufibacter glacialis]KAA6432463.1 helix-turn-helix domain-containing protein [Rufibacter glacialis]GGK78878.1 transcriptional regulator [Rufibacter glacialis]